MSSVIKKKPHVKSIDNNTRYILIISNFIVTLATLIRVAGAIITYIKVQERYNGTEDEKQKIMEVMVNMVLSIISISLMLVFSLMTTFLWRCERVLNYSLEIMAVLHTISFPFYTFDYDELILIQYT